MADVGRVLTRALKRAVAAADTVEVGVGSTFVLSLALAVLLSMTCGGCSSGSGFSTTEDSSASPSPEAGTPAVSSASLSSGTLTLQGTSLEIVTGISLSQNGNLIPLQILNRTASVLTATLATRASLSRSSLATLMLTTASASTPVVLTVDLSGTVVNGFTSIGISDLATATALTLSASNYVGIGTNNPGTVLNIKGSGASHWQGIVVQDVFTDNVAKGAVAVLGARMTNANAPFSGFSTWDEGSDRAIMIGGGGWGMPDANSIWFYTAPAYSETVDAGVARMVISSAGNVGIGTANPQRPLVVNRNTGTIPNDIGNVYVVGADAVNNVVALDAFAGQNNIIYRRADGTATAPTAVQQDEVIGQFGWRGYGTTGYSTGNRAQVRGMAAENWTDTAQGTYFSFWTTPAGTTATSEKVRIDASGNLGVGTSAPAQKLQVGASGDGTLAIANAWNTFSDARLKNVIGRIPNASERVDQLNGYYYTWKKGEDRSRQVGVLAQEVETDLPELVRTGSDGIKSVDYPKLTAVLIEAHKELSEKVKKQESEIRDLKAWACTKDPAALFCR